MELNKLIDNKNQKLWDEINQVHGISIEYSSNQEYGCYSEGKQSTIYVAKDNLEPDSFTHELLHIYIRIKEIYIGSGLKLQIQSSSILSRIFSEGLLEHFGNCLDHVKMLPIYLDLGFEREKFILDYHTLKSTDSQISQIKRMYKVQKIHNASAIDAFIGRFISIKADPNNTFDYTSHLRRLQKIDGKLFTVLNRFITAWEDFDINNPDPVFGYNYHPLLFDFYEGLMSWVKNKKIQ